MAADQQETLRRQEMGGRRAERQSFFFRVGNEAERQLSAGQGSVRVCWAFADGSTLPKSTIGTMLYKLMMKDDVRGAISVARDTISRIRMRETSIDEHIVTAGYNRKEEKYISKQKHTEVVKVPKSRAFFKKQNATQKQRARDPATAPRIGQRVAYVMITKQKGARGFECSEDPVYAMKNDCPIDTEYYVNNQLRKVRAFPHSFTDVGQPIKRVLKAIVPDPNMVFSSSATIDDILAGRTASMSSLSAIDPELPGTEKKKKTYWCKGRAMSTCIAKVSF
jgi:hypothetical protein